MPPSLLDPPPGDAFAVRNPQALAIDYEQTPPMFKVSDTHYAATWLLDERAPKIEKSSILKDRLQENSGRKQKMDKKEASFLQKTEQKQASVLIEARNLKQHFRIRSDYTIHAVDDVSFSIREGEIMALVGETGCGNPRQPERLQESTGLQAGRSFIREKECRIKRILSECGRKCRLRSR